MSEAQPGRAPGRPPAGPDGTRVADLPRLTVRLEPGTKERLQAAAAETGRPAWRIVQAALVAYLDTTTPRHHDTTP